MEIYRKLLKYVKPFKAKIGVAFFCMLLYSIFNSLVSVTTYIIFNGFSRGGTVSLDIPKVGGTLSFSVTMVPLIVISVFLFRGISDYVSNYLISNVGHRAVMNVRNEFYEHLSKLSLDYYSSGRTGDLISRAMNDVMHIQGAITNVLVDLVKQPLVILFNIPLVFYWDYKLAFISLVVFPLVAIPIVVFGKRLRKLTKMQQERTADITSVLQETINGIRVVKAFNMEESEVKKFRGINKSVFNYIIRTVKFTVIQRPLIEILGAFGVAFAIWYGLNNLPLDRFTAFIASLFILYEPLKKISKVNSTIQQAIGAGGRIFEVMDVEPHIVDHPEALELKEDVYRIDFENVSFSYGDSDKEVLTNIDLSANRGEVIALVGASGVGKTTLVSLLPRFYECTKGEVKINGIDIRDYKVKSLRSKIGVVTQESVLFNDTVSGNISYGLDSIDSDDVIEAAKAANADGFIRELPKGYDTLIGEKGVKLSGGQRQRLCIARAILKNPPILILDEATSQLDTESEREVQGALENLMKGKTVFVIAHRLSTVQKADRIVVLDKGQIVQVGTNDDLLAMGGQYKKLYDLQFNV